MAKFMVPFTGQTYALLRIVTGFLFLWHGAQKLFDFPTDAREGMSAFIMYGAGGIELIGGVLVMIGLFTRWTAFICCGFAAVAYWMAHGMNALLPFLNRGELITLYCFVFLYISANGSGMWAVDSLRNKSTS
ncbi:MAG: DoxX family protein [Gammaproteobacteria bacterium]|nr:DoxX family protein [Gammaproteobacteria bacterium]